MRILVGLIEHLGDIVACEPVSRYLKLNHPDAHLVWAVSAAYRELIDTNVYVDETLVMECLTDWIKLTKHHSYDKIVDLHVNYRICQHCGIPLVKEKGNPFVNAYEWFDYGTLLEAFSLGAGLPALSAQPNLYLKPEHAKAVDALALPEKYCVVHRESNESSKDWIDEAWRDLSLRIVSELNLHIIEVGAGKGRGPSPLVGHTSLVNRLPILQTAEVIRRAQFFIGIDSGPAHLANALKVPGIVLIGKLGFFRQYMPFNGFYSSASTRVKVVRNLAGPVAALSVDEVMEAVRYVSDAISNCEAHPAGGNGSAETTLPPFPAWHQEERRRVLDSNLFDAGWYGIHYPDVCGSGADPLDHFLTIGRAEGRSPGPYFNGERYLRENEDVARAGRNPLLHYIFAGRNEGRQRYIEVPGPNGWPEETRGFSNENRAVSVVDQPGKFAILDRSGKTSSDTKYPRTFAFYLPQFHPLNENNWAHGPGFTEWHSVVRTKPLFRGHYQPKVPGELGYYDLRSPDVLREQVRLAKLYGISGFCFYYYYFQGKTLLFQPIQNYIDSDLDAPFSLLWANENWSKRWDGGDKEVIIEQKHSKEDDVAVIRGLFPIFEDRRYVKINGKPILLIYKPHLFPDILSSTGLWREEAEKRGFPGLYLVMVDDWTPDPSHPRQYGFDASYEIPSNIVPREVLSTELDSMELIKDFEGNVVDYRKFANFHLSRPFPEYKRFRTVMLPWDNTARYGSRAIVHINGQGDSYKTWLTQALLDTYRRYEPEERIVFLHSWNEWCEGTYLEPDGKFGRLFLDQTGDAIRTVRNAIDLAESDPESASTIVDLLNVVQAKDEGAFRVMKATRAQTSYVWRELLKTREELVRLQDALDIRNQEVAVLKSSLAEGENHVRLVRADRDAICASKSWRLTRSLRAIGSIVRGQY